MHGAQRLHSAVLKSQERRKKKEDNAYAQGRIEGLTLGRPLSVTGCSESGHARWAQNLKARDGAHAMVSGHALELAESQSANRTVPGAT
eukprot:2630002-Pleurochrysis_carterae.AAC.1